jgi:hypothetical protein
MLRFELRNTRVEERDHASSNNKSYIILSMQWEGVERKGSGFIFTKLSSVLTGQFIRNASQRTYSA